MSQAHLDPMGPPPEASLQAPPPMPMMQFGMPGGEQIFPKIVRTIVRTRWTDDEDARLIQAVTVSGATCWDNIAKCVQTRSAAQCNQRWVHQKNPGLNLAQFSAAEDAIIVRGVQQFGQKWTQIAGTLHNRSSARVKNRWQTLRSNKQHALFMHARVAGLNDVPCVENAAAASLVELQTAVQPPLAKPPSLETLAAERRLVCDEAVVEHEREVHSLVGLRGDAQRFVGDTSSSELDSSNTSRVKQAEGAMVEGLHGAPAW